MNKFSFSIAAAAACTSFLATAQSSPPKDKLEEMVITSSRVPMPLREVGTSISVITQDEIFEMGFNSLFDILRTQPGVAVSNAGGPGGSSAMRIRGEDGFRTLVLLDGIDISDTASPQAGPRV